MAYKDPERAKEYSKKYGPEWYKKNRTARRESINARKKSVVDWLSRYKEERGCQICGERFPVCLEFHHRDPVDKKFEIAKMAHDGNRKERILAEVEKCDLLCSNCHRKEHHRELYDEWLAKQSMVVVV